jgi:type II secretory pathway pseudopilin PulG
MAPKVRARAARGFTLIEILLVIAILMGISVMEMRRDSAAANALAAAATGRQAALVGAAVDQYLAAHPGRLQTMTDPNCVSSGNYCDLSFAALIAQNYLPASFDNTVSFGGSYGVRVLRVAPPLPAQAASICSTGNPAPLGCPVPYPSGTVPTWQYALRAAVYTQQPWMIGSGASVNLNGLGEAARHAGPQAGIARGGVVNGFGGSWSIGAEFGLPWVDGQLVYLAGSKASLWSQFLDADGTRPMTGNFDAGSYNLMSMRDMFINGPISNPRNKNLSSMMPNWVFKGVYAAKDGDFVPSPVCEGGGVAKVKVLMQLMKGTKAGFYYDNGGFTTTTSQATAQAQLAANAARHQLNNWADATAGGWIVHFQDKFNQDDASGNSSLVTGEGLAELYCHYPDQ